MVTTAAVPVPGLSPGPGNYRQPFRAFRTDNSRPFHPQLLLLTPFLQLAKIIDRLWGITSTE